MQTSWQEENKRLTKLFQQHGGLLTRKQVEAERLPPYLLTRWVRHGMAERLQRGIYRAVDSSMQPYEGLLEVQLRIPYGVVCLASALAFHGLTTFIPKTIQLAVPRKRKPPKLEYPPTEIVYFSDKRYSYGLETHRIVNHDLHIYSPEKTLADLLRNQKQLGAELFREGLKNYLQRKKPKADIQALLAAAKVCGVEAKLRPLLEVLLHEATI
jgi:predicted transcriptional regulator of viral defense system